MIIVTLGLGCSDLELRSTSLFLMSRIAINIIGYPKYEYKTPAIQTQKTVSMVA
jgi:hypothetical protein